MEKQAVNVERIKLQEEYKSKLALRELQAEKSQSKYFMVFLGLICILLTLALVLVKYRNKIAYNRIERELITSKNKELTSTLDQKNSELVSKTMVEAHIANAITSVLDDLKLLKRKAVKKETQLLIAQVMKKLERDLNPDVWKEFEIGFAQVHQSFFKNLAEKHPKLSPKDRCLCILLFLDFSTKEIAKLTGMSFKAIENSRTRLRKKLLLTNKKVNVSTYLRSLS